MKLDEMKKERALLSEKLSNLSKEIDDSENQIRKFNRELGFGTDKVKELQKRIKEIYKERPPTHEKVVALENEIAVQTRSGFLDRRRKILRARADATKGILEACKQEMEIDEEIKNLGVSITGYPFHDQQSTCSAETIKVLTEWITKYNEHKFENK